MSESESTKLVLWLIPLAPLAAAIVTALLGPKLLRAAQPFAVLVRAGGVGGLLVRAAVLDRAGRFHASMAARRSIATGYQWLDVGGINVRVDLRADAMTAHHARDGHVREPAGGDLRAGYMHGDPGYPRFFAALSLFVFSMCMLVLAGNFLLLFVFWEGVGLCSYLLIGFWFHKPAAAAAAKKAFVVNRIGDFGFLLGIFLIWTTFGSLDFADVLLDPERHWRQSRRRSPGTITLICLLLFLGAMGKSAQFPLHVWLPDAMEGPTPVSALIHAATMVTAGVYLVARCTPLFVHAPDGAAGRRRHRRASRRCSRRSSR